MLHWLLLGCDLISVGHDRAALVITDNRTGKLGCVAPIRWNPLEGSSNGPAQVLTRGNCDYQCMMRTFSEGFRPAAERDELRDPPLTAAQVAAAEQAQLKALQDEFEEQAKEIQKGRNHNGLQPFTEAELAEQLSPSFELRLKQLKRGHRIGDRLVSSEKRRFATWVRKLVVDTMASSLAATFYACDYSTKPSMTCAPLLVAIRDGLRKLEEQLEAEREEQRLEELRAERRDPNSSADLPAQTQQQQPGQQENPQQKRRPMSALQRETARRLIRQAKAANQAQVKGNCLMIMQMLTGREVLRSHYAWQLMLKHPVFMAMEHRRRLEGFTERRRNEVVPVTLVEAAGEAEASDSSSSESAESGDCDPAIGDDAQQDDDADAADDVVGQSVAPSAAGAAEQNPTTRCRLRNDTFYDDYLHRGSWDFAAGFGTVATPLCNMALYEYAMFVRIVPGDPWALKPGQYAFEEHHAKFDAFVQELRPSPVPPYIHGFTMPTAQKDPETNALFKQLLLRPHRCKGRKHCLGYDATSAFCDCKLARRLVLDEDGVPKKDLDGRDVFERRPVYSYTRQWRLFEASQAALALRADEKIHATLRLPVLQDVTSLRCWWLPGAQRGGEVHKDLAPALATKLPLNIVWVILRFAGYFRDAAGDVIGVGNTQAEAEALRKVFGMQVPFTSQGVHDEQLTTEEFFAWRRCECAARLEYMAEARRRPRPGNAHPDAVPDDPDGVHGGEAAEDADFDCDDALPGRDGSDEEAAELTRAQVDPDIFYAPRQLVREDEFWDVLHRYPQLKQQLRDTGAPKHKVMKKFARDHELMYQRARAPTALAPIGGDGRSTADAAAAGEMALRNQQACVEDKGREADATTRLRRFAGGQQARPDTGAGAPRQLAASELPLSPFAMAVPLIARSGVWRSREQYLTTIYLLQPLQQLWKLALREGTADLLRDPAFLARHAKDVPVRRIFLHGPGGSGKTYFVTEVVLPVARHFFGETGVKAIAAHNSAARLLLGSTMHSAAKLTRGQSMKAKKLRPKPRARKALENEWSRTACLVADELGLASPKLFAAVSRRAFYGRAKDRGFDARCSELAVEHPFGDVPIQVVAADMMQLNPVRSHSMVEAYCSSKVPGVPAKTADEDKEGYDILRRGFSEVVLFTGSYRFLGEELPALLRIMATPGGAPVPEDLRAKVLDRIQAGPGDPRVQTDYGVDGKIGFFPFGAHAAIQWEQVMRMNNLHVLQAARFSRGPSALCNNDDGKPGVAEGWSAGPAGQLVCPDGAGTHARTITIDT